MIQKPDDRRQKTEKRKKIGFRVEARNDKGKKQKTEKRKKIGFRVEARNDKGKKQKTDKRKKIGFRVRHGMTKRERQRTPIRHFMSDRAFRWVFSDTLQYIISIYSFFLRIQIDIVAVINIV